jgi:hypothetical protein
MNISVVSSVDESSRRLNSKVIPLALEALQGASMVDYSERESVMSRLRGMGHYASDGDLAKHVVLSLSFDPKTCGIPMDHCRAECGGCNYNPLTGLFDPYLARTPLVVTSRDTIDALLDASFICR